MRIGKPLEHAQAAVKALDVSDPVIKFTALGRQLGYAGYLFNDMLVWVRPCSLSSSVETSQCRGNNKADGFCFPHRQAHSTKVRPLAPTQYNTIQRRAAKLWFTGIAFSLVSSVYKLVGLRKRQQVVARPRGDAEKEIERKIEVRNIKA